MDFILGLGIALPVTLSTAVGTVTAVAEGVSHQRKMNEEASSETRSLKFHADVLLAHPARYTRDRSASRTPAETGAIRAALHGGMAVLRDGRVWVVERDGATQQPVGGEHPFTGFYLQYPVDEDRPNTRGMVSTISREPPVLNWLYVDKDTGQVRYSNRTGSREHHVGEWDWTEESGAESRVSFEGWEGWVAVREGGGWGLYFDLGDDGLKGKVDKGKRKVEVLLYRRLLGAQEMNKWGLGSSGNLGVKKTEHSVKGRDVLKEEAEEEEQTQKESG